MSLSRLVGKTITITAAGHAPAVARRLDRRPEVGRDLGCEVDR